MPQIQPGKGIQPGADGAPKLYGTDKVENSIPFQERMMRRFKPSEFVIIKNIDDEPLYWQYMPAEAETMNFSEDGMQRQIYRDEPEMWMIPAGETEVVVGASAFRALDVLYKNYMAKSTLRRFRDPSSPQFNDKNEHLPKNFNYADGGAQEAFLDMAFIGKAMPTFSDGAAANTTSVEPSQPVAAESVVHTPAYAEPDEVRDTAINKAKELTNAGTRKK